MTELHQSGLPKNLEFGNSGKNYLKFQKIRKEPEKTEILNEKYLKSCNFNQLLYVKKYFSINNNL